MAEDIRISPDEMRRRSGEYAAEAENIGRTIQKMDQLIKDLQDEWRGESSKAFAEQYGLLKPGFENMQSLVETISRQLTQTAGAMEERDGEISRGFGLA